MTLEEIKENFTAQCKACEFSRPNGKCVEDGECQKVQKACVKALEELEMYKSLGVENIIALKKQVEDYDENHALTYKQGKEDGIADMREAIKKDLPRSYAWYDDEIDEIAEKVKNGE